jgi:hypothetical protein
MNINEKAAVVVELGMVRLTQFDASKRIAGCDVAARNLDTAQVRYTRAGGVLMVPVCRHKSQDGPTHDHECEGHSHGHVCYHARAGLMYAAAVGGATVTFHDTEAEARQVGGIVCRVMVPGHEDKAKFAAYKRNK